jgi:hypothetical protein
VTPARPVTWLRESAGSTSSFCGCKGFSVVGTAVAHDVESRDRGGRSSADCSSARGPSQPRGDVEQYPASERRKTSTGSP